ncbi:MAG: FAD-binding protein [Anaerolineae bacterium]|nr:FAD-binding protein [Anaerolineae bacterium]
MLNPSSNVPATWVYDLRAALSPGAFITAAPDVCARYAEDRAHTGVCPGLVLKPATLQDIATAVAWAYPQRIPVVPRGLATTAHGESVPGSSGLLIDLAQFNRIGTVDAGSGTVTVAAGAAWGDLEAHLAVQGFALYTYPASRFSTVGGWIATGGLGVNAFGYGHLRRWVTTLNMITSTGETRVLTPRDKAFDAVFGAEGQMGIVAEATLRVRPAPTSARAHLFYFDAAGDQFGFVRHLIGWEADLAHVALYSPDYMAYFNRLYNEAHPDRTPFYELRAAALVHVDSGEQQRALEDALACADFLVEEAPPYAAAALWRQRFYPLAVKRYGPDLLEVPVTLPLEAAAGFLDETAARVASFGLNPTITTVIAPAREAGEHDLALVMPRIPCDMRSRARPFYRLLAHLITHDAIRRGGAPYAVGHVNAPFARIREERHPRLSQAHRRAADPAGLFNPRQVAGMTRRLFRPMLGLARAFAGQLGQVARSLHHSLPPGLPPRPAAAGDRPLADAELAAVIGACTGCGNCIPVCPAFLLTRDEASTARVKLQTGRRLLDGETVDPARAEATFLCTYCGACRDVCETELPLLAAYAAIEHKLAAQHGIPEAAVARFVAAVETHPAYMQFTGLPSGFPEAPGLPETPVAAPPRREPVGPYSVVRSEHCINCGRCAMVCPAGVHARRADDPRRMLMPAAHRCVACMRCVQHCPTRALTVAPSPTYARLGRGIYTPGVVHRLAQQAGAGAAPGAPAEAGWLDTNPVLYPPLLPGEVQPGVTLGRRLERLPFGAGGVASALPPIVELAAPLVLALPPGAPAHLADVILQAAHDLGTLALVDAVTGPAHAAHAALRIPPGRRGDIEDAGLLVIDPADAALVPHLHTRRRDLAVGVAIPLDRHTPGAALEWVGAGVQVLILDGPDGFDVAAARDSTAHLAAVHGALNDHARRDRVSLVVRGAVTGAARMVEMMLFGADAVIVDWALLAALECRLQGGCGEGDHQCGLDRVEAAWAVARVTNLVHAWEDELRATLAALGLRRAHQLRDAGDRIRFDPDADLAGLAALPYLAPADRSLVQLLGS